MSRAVDVAYGHIRRGIVVGDLRSGDVLGESRLAQEIGVSRTPVREALGRLHAEGLVVLERYRKCTVAKLTADDMAERYRLRAMLEGHAASRAATRITEAQLTELEAIEDQMEAAFHADGWHGHLPEFDRLNNEFHALIARAADSSRLVDVLASALELPASIFPNYSEPGTARTLRTHRQHREIIAALRMRNAPWAEAEMAAHLLSIVVTG
jgi:DNA-binding GntR family transcriptional regulator